MRRTRLPSGESWHRDLLVAVAQKSSLRPEILSPAVTTALGEMLAFRHYLIHGSVIVQPDGE